MAGAGTSGADLSRQADPPRQGGREHQGRIQISVERPNIVLVVSDDQRWDTLDPEANVMPLLAENLLPESTLFRNAVVSSPLCCPSRTSILSGGYAVHHTGVLVNQPPNGGARAFVDSRSLATLLQDRGYLTLYIGKYMNGYSQLAAFDPDGGFVPSGHYIPPGWDAFMPYLDDGFDWYQYRLGVGTSDGRGPTRGLLLPEEEAQRGEILAGLVAAGLPQGLADYFLALDFQDQRYAQEHEKALALAAIEAAALVPEQPFFLLLSLAAPHYPALPPPQDQSLFLDFHYDERGYGEEDLSDKPLHIRLEGESFEPLLSGTEPFLDDGRLPQQFFADQWRSLRGVDRTIDAVVSRLKEDPELWARTVVFFMSDHGLMWGEHRILGRKKVPYEESIRIPLLMRVPGNQLRFSHDLVAGDLDVPATILDLAGFGPDFLGGVLGIDGRSLIQRGGERASRPDRRYVLIQDYRRNPRHSPPSWQAIRTHRWKYVSHDTGEEELYYLPEDPFELESLHSSPRPRDQRARARLGSMLERTRGLIFMSTGWENGALPSAVTGELYRFQLAAAGGTPPYEWFEAPASVLARQRGDCVRRLPSGVTLSAAGLVLGTPSETGCFSIPVGVRDSSVSPQNGAAQQFIREMRLTVD